MSEFVEPRLVCVVEGDGEVEALPILVRRIVAEVLPEAYIACQRPILTRRDRLLRRSDELERVMLLARAKAGVHGAILLVIDSDGEPPCQVGPELLRRALPIAAGLQVGVVVAHREFEAWFLAAAESLRGHRELSQSMSGPADPEAIRDAKGWLRRHMPPGCRYGETTDQPALAQIFDLQAARRAPSFDKCYREVTRLATELIYPELNPEDPG